MKEVDGKKDAYRSAVKVTIGAGFEAKTDDQTGFDRKALTCKRPPMFSLQGALMS